MNGYSIVGYGRMLQPSARIEAYVAAMRRAILPGMVVLDVGAGPGFFAVLACKLGARHVFAVEPDVSILLAREIAAANGVQDQISFLQDASTNVVLPTKADVLVSDLRGVVPLLTGNIPSIIDARRRLIAPGATLIGARDTLWVALAEVPEAHAVLTQPWSDGLHGVRLDAGLRFTTNSFSRQLVRPDELLSEGACWGEIDYRTVTSPNLAGEVILRATTPGTAHGLCVWFDAHLDDESGFSNAPGAPELIYGRLFFPFQSPIAVKGGDAVRVRLRADLMGGDYVWRWDGQRHTEAGRRDFAQCSMGSGPISAEHLRRRAGSYVPALGEDDSLDARILSLVDGRRSLQDIAEIIAHEFPARFPDGVSAIARVGDVSTRHSPRPCA